MGISPYIDRLVAREKRARMSYRDTTLERIMEWHRKRIRELDASNAGLVEGTKMVKQKAARQMHAMTLTYLEKVNNK